MAELPCIVGLVSLRSYGVLDEGELGFVSDLDGVSVVECRAVDSFSVQVGAVGRVEVEEDEGVRGDVVGDQGLMALIEKPAGVEQWNGPYLRKKTIRNDPWGNEYHYRYPGENGPFDLYSLGADNVQGGEDEDRDVLSWE